MKKRTRTCEIPMARTFHQRTTRLDLTETEKNLSVHQVFNNTAFLSSGKVPTLLPQSFIRIGTEDLNRHEQRGDAVHRKKKTVTFSDAQFWKNCMRFFFE
jgi:hypothetical protein